MLTVSQNDALAKIAIEEGLGVTVSVPFAGLVVADADGLAGALVFNGFDRINIDMTVLLLRPWQMRNLRDIARYVFVRLGCRRVTCVTPATNARAINRLIRLGFEREGLMRDRFPSGDGIVFGLTTSNQRFLRLSDGLTTSDHGS